jgi:hypothetical protein
LSATDKIAVINTSDWSVAYSAVDSGSAPWGISVSPVSPYNVYVANSFSSVGASFGTVSYYNASGVKQNVVDVDKQPQAFGKFIGPMMYPITVTQTAHGTIAPTVGSVGSDSKIYYVSTAQPAFTITPASGYNVYKVTVGGSEQATALTSYSFSSGVGAAPTSITATYATPYTVNVTKDGTGTGTISCTSNNYFKSPIYTTAISCGSTCSAIYPDDTTTITCTQSASTGSFSSWSGACTGSGTCSFSLNGNKTVNATFSLGGPVLIGATYYTSISDAYTNGLPTSGLTMKVKDINNFGTGYNAQGPFTWQKVFTFDGGYDNSHSTHTASTYATQLKTSLTISTGGTVTFLGSTTIIP